MLRRPDRHHLRPLSTIPSSRSCSKKEHRTLCAYLRTAAAAGGTYVRPPAAPPLDFPLTDSALYDSRRRPPGGRRPRRGIPSRGRSIPPPFQPQSGPFCRNLLSQLRREKHRYIYKKQSPYLQIQVRGRAKSGTQIHCGRARGRRSGTAAAREPERVVVAAAAARRTDRRMVGDGVAPAEPGPVAAADRPRAVERRRRGALGGMRRARDRGPLRRRAPTRAAAP